MTNKEIIIESLVYWMINKQRSPKDPSVLREELSLLSDKEVTDLASDILNDSDQSS